MGRRSRGRMEATLNIALSNAELEELHRRAKGVSLKTSEWARRVLFAYPQGAAPPPTPDGVVERDPKPAPVDDYPDDERTQPG